MTVMQRRYVVKEIQGEPRPSGLNRAAPRSLYMLMRHADGKHFKVLLERSSGGKVGEVILLDDPTFESARI
jgi:hypothetical protein